MATRRSCSGTPRHRRSGSATPTTRRCGRWWHRWPGAHLEFSIAGRADGWFDRAGGRLMLGERAAHGPRATSAPGRPQRRQRARRGSRGAPGGMRHRSDRGRARTLSGHSPSGRAGARGGRRALDQRLQVHQHHVAPKSRWRRSTGPSCCCLGGRHKGEPYTRLAGPLKGRCRACGGLRRGRTTGDG